MIYLNGYLSRSMYIVVLLALVNHLHAQNVNPKFADKNIAGIPFIQNYTPKDYNADGQNWAIVQDRRGIMYFGNSDGVLEYDGVSWRLIETNKKSVIRSLAVDKYNRIYVGAYGEIGYLAPDSSGQLQYLSLLPYLDKNYHEFADVWQTLVTGNGVYFVTQKYIFRWANQQMRIWQAQTAFHIGSLTDDQFYVRQWNVGLMQMVSDSLRVVPGGEKFGRIRITARLPYTRRDSSGKNKDLTLLGTQAQGLFLYDGVSAMPFPTPVDELLKKAQIYHGVKLPNGDYAFATIEDGIFVIDESGNLRYHLNKASGLQDETIWFLYVDNQGGLWTGTNGGISRIEIGAPLTQFTEREGVEGGVYDIIRHHGELYIANSMGMYYLDENPKNARNRVDAGKPSGHFKRVSGIPPQCWKLLAVGQTLLGGTFEGIYEIRGHQAREVIRGYVFFLARSQQDTNRVFAGLQGGLMSLYYAGGRWQDEGQVEGITREIRDILESPDGKLWLTTRYQGLLQVDFSGGFTLRPQIAHFDTLQGLPPGDRIAPFMTARGVRFATPRGIYRFDETQQQFAEDSSLVKGFLKEQPLIFSATEDRLKDLWLVGTKSLKAGVARHQPDGAYSWEETPFLRMNDIETYLAYPDPLREEITWFGCLDRVIQYDASVPQNYALDYGTFIRQVIINGDSLIYGGTSPPAPLQRGEPTISPFEGGLRGMSPTLEYANNSLRFRYAAPSFDAESQNEYQYFLEGFDKNWSTWSSESQKEYTNLPEGGYRLQVRAKNIYRHVSASAVYEFKILPPFYRSWWAYFFYFLLFIGILYGIRQYEINRLNRKHFREVEQLQYKKLKELHHLRSRFFANISHEFRTPLALILGPIEKALLRAGEHLSVKDLHLIRYNANFLLRLINQLLDLVRLESGKLRLQVQQGDIVRFLKAMTMVFESQAARKQIMLRFRAEPEQINAWFDRRILEDIFYNLLSNAIKFTPQGGEIQVAVAVSSGSQFSTTAAATATATHGLPREFVEITVSDTGIGIPAEHLSHIFDRFYRVDDFSNEETLHKTSQQGVGIGLMLVKEWVELHRGTIGIESPESSGTAVTVLLPLGKTHLKPEEMVELKSSEDLNTPQSLEEISDFDSRETTAEAQDAGEVSEDDTIILVIEDNAGLRAYIREHLQPEYNVLEAKNGDEGIAKALETIPDLVISDVKMPGKDGYQVCAALKTDVKTSHVPIILLTAKAEAAEKIQGLETGADAYMIKPFSFEELLVRTRNLIDQRRKLRQRFSGSVALKPSEIAVSTMDAAFLERLLTVVEKHMAEEKLTVDTLAREAAMSRSQIHRKLRALTNQSCEQFILSVRLQRAAELLRQKAATVSEIAYQTGFGSPSYFAACFKKQFGCPPSEYGG